MLKMKKWLIAAALSSGGLLVFIITSLLVGRFDKGQIAESQARGVSGGQFNGAGQEILHLIFLYLLVFFAVAGLAAFGIAALVKWRRPTLVRTSYGTLYYWCGLMPIVSFLLIFPAWALFMTLSDSSLAP